MTARAATSVTAAIVLVLCAALVGAASAGSIDLGRGDIVGQFEGSRDIQETIWFQGFVTDDATGEPINATYTVTARIYDAEASGSSVWGPETHVATVISGGWFNIELGNVIGGLPAFDAPPYYLQLTINSEVLSPRLKLASVPSAFQSMGADNGFSLPYSDTYAGGGDAFSVTNTGPNSAGYFRINNAASSATAVYGNHNGTGAALLGWHTGSGPALRAVANGSGYAGKFEGAVVVEDSMSVGGILTARGNLAVRDTILIGEGIWFAHNPVPGYVLRCADAWGNAEWAPANVIATDTESATTTIGASVTQYHDCEVTLTVPGPGYIVVESQLWVNLSHSSGTDDTIVCGISDSPTAMPSWTRVSCVTIPGALPTASGVYQTLYTHNTFAVADAGTYTYYQVGYMYSGQDASDYFWYAHMRGVWYPHPIPRETETEDGELSLEEKLRTIGQ